MTADKMNKLTDLSVGNSKRSSVLVLASILLVLSCSSISVTAQKDPQELGELELCPTTCACPVPAPAGEGAEGTGEAGTGATGNSIVVTRQKCDPNDVETCQANW